MLQNNFWQTECLRGLIFHQHNYVIETVMVHCVVLKKRVVMLKLSPKRREYVMSITSFHLNNTLFCFVSCSSVMSCVTVSIYLVILLSLSNPVWSFTNDTNRVRNVYIYKYSDMQSIQTINREFG